MRWRSENYKWLIDGVGGAAIIAVIGYLIHRFLGTKDQQFAPEVVLEYECEISGLANKPLSEQTMKERRKPLSLRNLGGGTAYHVKVEDIASGQCTAKFDEISQIAEKSDATSLPTVTDHAVIRGVDAENALRHDFVHLLERTYQTCVHDFDSIRVPVKVHYEDRNGKRFETLCVIEFDYFKTIARTKCKPPRPMKATVRG